MTLFTGQRDASLINTLNKELIIDIIDTEVRYYKIMLDETELNIYGESDSKQYYDPQKISCLIKRDEQDYDNTEFGVDYTAAARFAFLRDTLVIKSIYVQPGDIIEWDNEYYEVDGIPENQYWGGKNPDTNEGGSEHGYNVSIICNAHIIKRDKLNLVRTHHGTEEE